MSTARSPLMVADLDANDADDDLTEEDEDASEYLSRRAASSQTSLSASMGEKQNVATAAKYSWNPIDDSTKLRSPLVHHNYPSDSAVANHRPLTVAPAGGYVPSYSKKASPSVVSSRNEPPKSIPVVQSPSRRGKHGSRGAQRISGDKPRSPPIGVEVIDVDALSDSPPPPSKAPTRMPASRSAKFDIGSIRFSPSSILPPQSLHTTTLVKSSRNASTRNSTSKGTVAKPKKLTQREIHAEEKRLKKLEARMSNAQYIDHLPMRYTPAKRAENRQFLKGAIILLARPMSEQNGFCRDVLKMLYLSGAELVSKYQPDITHIVEKKRPDTETVRNVNAAIGVRSVPLRIKIVKWDWVLYCSSGGGIQPPRITDYVHDARGNYDYGITPVLTHIKRKREVEVLDSEDEEKKRREKRQKLTVGEPSAMPKREGKEREWERCYVAAAMNSDDEESGDDRMVSKFRNFQCMQKRDKVRKECPNQDIVDKLRELANIHRNRPGDENHWRAYSYSKAIAAVKRCHYRIETWEEARQIYGVGVRTADKIMEFIETGNIKRIQYEQDEKTVVSGVFRGIYGVGTTVAYDWYSCGLRTLDDVKERKFGIKLTPAQEIGLKYYEDLSSRMPREEAQDIFDQIMVHARSIDSKLSVEIMGSYRRGAETCGDIDILITRNPEDGVDHKTLDVLPRLLKKLHAAKILVADLGGGDGDDLETKYMGLCRRSARDKVRRIDILTIPYSQWPGALIYFTGDDIFNRSMRLLANKKGMSLNQRGLYTGVIRDPRTRQKTAAGTLLDLRTERAIFDHLGVPWQEPHQRVRA